MQINPNIKIGKGSKPVSKHKNYKWPTEIGKKILQFISKLRNVAYNNVIPLLYLLTCQILKNRYIVHSCQGTKSGILIHHWREMSLDLPGSKFNNMSSAWALKKNVWFGVPILEICPMEIHSLHRFVIDYFKNPETDVQPKGIG